MLLHIFAGDQGPEAPPPHDLHGRVRPHHRLQGACLPGFPWAAGLAGLGGPSPAPALGGPSLLPTRSRVGRISQLRCCALAALVPGGHVPERPVAPAIGATADGVGFLIQVRTASCSGTACLNSFGDEQLAVDVLADKLLFETLKYSGARSTPIRCQCSSFAGTRERVAAGPISPVWIKWSHNR